MNSYETILGTVVAIVDSEVDRQRVADAVEPHHRLREDLFLDSLNLVTLVVSLEDTFGITFDPLQDDLVVIFTDSSSLAAYIFAKTQSAEYCSTKQNIVE